MEDKINEAIEILEKIFIADGITVSKILQQSLVDTGKITNREMQSLVACTTPLEKINKEIIIWIYEALYKAFNLPEPIKYFSKKEIQSADLFHIKRYQSQYPLKFVILDRLAYGHQYLITQSIQEIQTLKESGIIIWDKNIQRESIITKIGDEMVAHIRYDDKRAREIGDKIARNEYYSNSLRWHLIVNGKEDYYIDDSVEPNILIINSGTIAEIDGQHRDKGSEYALLKNPNVYMKFPILFTIGTTTQGQSIIYQEEKRAPINRRHVQTYSNTASNRIVNLIIGSEKLDNVYKVVDTLQAVNNNGGFVLKSILSDAINKYYKLQSRSISRIQEQKISDWIIKFLNELADIYFEDFVNYITVSKTKWNVSPFSFYGYIYLSSVLQNQEDWEQKLREMLNQIDFNNKPWVSITNAHKFVEKIFKEVAS